MFEHRTHPLLPRTAFILRTVKFGAAAGVLIALSLGAGAIGYHVLEGQRWIDATYSAAMILSGMGPATDVKTDTGKIFVTIYALYSALVFLTAGAIVLTPVAHRALHLFHVETRRADARGAAHEVQSKAPGEESRR